MFADWANLYDAIYAAKGKDYGAEVRALLRWVGPPVAVRVSAALAEARAQGEAPSARRTLDGVTESPRHAPHGVGGTTDAAPRERDGATATTEAPHHSLRGTADATAVPRPSGDDAPSAPGHASKASAEASAGFSSVAPVRPSLLDVACGTGEHLRHFAEHFEVAGVDTCPEMLAVARRKLPSATLSLADMTSFDLGRRFDVVTCLFSSVGYLRSVAELDCTVQRMAAHLADDGVLLLEPPVSPDRLHPPRTTMLHFVHEGRSWERETSARIEGPTLYIRFVLRCVDDDDPRFEVVDEQPIRLFRDEEIVAAMESAGLELEFDARGPSGLGLHVGRRAGTKHLGNYV